MRVSHSSMDCYRQCPHKYYLSRVEGLSSVDKPRAPSFGSAFHEALNAHHAHLPFKDIGAVLEVWEAATLKWGLSREDLILGRALLIAYSVKYADDDSGGKVEEGFSAPVLGLDGEPAGIDLTGYMDVEHDAYIMDHKTTSSNLTPTFIKNLAQTPQAEEYLMAAQDNGSSASYAIWDLVKAAKFTRLLATPLADREYYKVNCKGGKKGDLKATCRDRDETWLEFEARVQEAIAKDPDSFLVRVKIEPTEADLDKRRYDIYATAKNIQRAIEDSAFPRSEKSCNLYGGCEFKPICWDGVDPKQSDLYQLRKSTR